MHITKSRASLAAVSLEPGERTFITYALYYLANDAPLTVVSLIQPFVKVSSQQYVYAQCRLLMPKLIYWKMK